MRTGLNKFKVTIISLLLIMSCFVFFGCGSDSEPSTDVTDSSIEAEEATLDTPENANVPTEEDSKALAKEYFDLDSYEDGLNLDNKNAEDFKTVTIDGETIPAGISYSELLNLGWKPLVEDFADKEPGTMALTSPFENSEGKTITFGIAADGESKKVKDGYLCLYSLELTEKNPVEFLVDGVGIGSSIDDVVKTFGDKPESLGFSDYYIDDQRNSGTCLKLGYSVEDKAHEVRIAVNPLTRKVVSMSLQLID